MHKIAIVGCGAMSDEWIMAAKKRTDCQIVALVDINADMAKRKREGNGLTCEVYTSLADALKRGDVHLVFDITPPNIHFATVTTALKAGCHVFGEKPIADSLENARKMIQCSDETGKEYFVMQNRRYLPALFAMKNFLQTRPLGDIGQISINFRKNPHFNNYRDVMDNPLISEMSIHAFDAVRFVLGRNAKSVFCHEFNPSWSWYKGNASAICVFEMDDGSVFDYRGTWCSSGLNTSWESEWYVSCEKGTVYWDGAGALIYNVNKGKEGGNPDDDSSKTCTIEPAVMAEIEHEACISDMFHAINQGVRPPTDCRDNINSVKMVYAAIESAKQRKVMAI
ncbi:MAG: Gfo/Idh/MocA family oxidoreductase [Phycisphaerales bacterium]|nr:Gfo/Idh/MocA family oxidoreductase [Phycisphaerales bacterium]